MMLTLQKRVVLQARLHALVTRPVVMEMMREWINHILKERKTQLR
jgi:hypothetical protein